MVIGGSSLAPWHLCFMSLWTSGIKAPYLGTIRRDLVLRCIFLLHLYPYVLSVFRWFFLPYDINASNVQILILCILQGGRGAEIPAHWLHFKKVMPSYKNCVISIPIWKNESRHLNFSSATVFNISFFFHLKGQEVVLSWQQYIPSQRRL